MRHTCISTNNWTGNALGHGNESRGDSSAPDRRWQSSSWYRIEVQDRGPTVVSNMSPGDQVWRLDGLPSSFPSVGVHHRKRAKRADSDPR